jgi:hypothetical protein
MPAEPPTAAQLAQHFESTTVPPSSTVRSVATNSGDDGDPVLEQVADAGPVTGVEQFGGVALLDVLTERDHGEAGMGGRQRSGCAQALVPEAGGHPHIGEVAEL